MKKSLLLFLAAFMLLAGTAAAQTANAIAGKYNGDLYISFVPITAETEPIADQRIDITAGAAGGTIDFALYNFSFNDMKLGDILLPAIGFTTEGERTTFAENPLVDLSFLGGGILATARLNHDESYVEGRKLHAVIDVMWTNTGSDPLPIYVMFDGTLTTPAGIDHVAADGRSEAVYDLQGRYRGQSLRGLEKGIYVKGGRKVLVK